MIGELIMIILKAIMIVYLFVVKVVHEYFFRNRTAIKKVGECTLSLLFSFNVYRSLDGATIVRRVSALFVR